VSLCQISSKSVKPRPKYGDFPIFQDGGRPPAWICCVSDWTTHEGRFGGLYHCVKVGWNRCGSFDDMQVLVFCDFGWKTPIHAPFWGVFGAQFPQNMSLIVLTPKRTVLGRNHVIWAIKREYRPRGSSWALEREKKDRTGKKTPKGYISPVML